MPPTATSQRPSVAVVGLGYIGLPTAAVLASSGAEVVGVDINADAVATINAGQVPFVEPDMATTVAGVVLSGLSAGHDRDPARGQLHRRGADARSRTGTNLICPTSRPRASRSLPCSTATSSSSSNRLRLPEQRSSWPRRSSMPARTSPSNPAAHRPSTLHTVLSASCPDGS